MKREHGEPRAYRPCHKPAGAGAIVAMQPIHPKEQDLSLRRLRDALCLPAERGSQFGFEALALGAGHHRGRHPSLGQKAPEANVLLLPTTAIKTARSAEQHLLRMVLVEKVVEVGEGHLGTISRASRNRRPLTSAVSADVVAASLPRARSP